MATTEWKVQTLGQNKTIQDIAAAAEKASSLITVNVELASSALKLAGVFLTGLLAPQILLLRVTADAIDDFVNNMNETVYGLNFESPYGMGNPSWCKLNVTNCSPPGFMSACPSHPDQLGYLSIFKSDGDTIKVCSNLEYSSGRLDDW